AEPQVKFIASGLSHKPSQSIRLQKVNNFFAGINDVIWKLNKWSFRQNISEGKLYINETVSFYF
ncbi:MAG: hypothetical protein ACOCQH_03280, partial [Halanaerobiales bacterium]